MGMSSSVYGIRKPDDKWKKYKKIIDTLETAGLSWEDAPDEVLEFFGHSQPDPDGITVEFGSDYMPQKHECCSEYSDECSTGFIIDISKLPKNITHIKFTNSW